MDKEKKRRDPEAKDEIDDRTELEAMGGTYAEKMERRSPGETNAEKMEKRTMEVIIKAEVKTEVDEIKEMKAKAMHEMRKVDANLGKVMEEMQKMNTQATNEMRSEKKGKGMYETGLESVKTKAMEETFPGVPTPSLLPGEKLSYMSDYESSLRRQAQSLSDSWYPESLGPVSEGWEATSSSSEFARKKAMDEMRLEKVLSIARDAGCSETAVDKAMKIQAIDGAHLKKSIAKAMMETEERTFATAETVERTTVSNAEIRMLIKKVLRQTSDDSARSELAKAMRGTRTLNLSGAFDNYKDADRVKALAFVFRVVDIASLECLSLERNNIDSVSLALSLQDFKGDSLRELDLSNNHLQGEGIETFCSFNWSQLQRLVLRGNNIQDLGCKHLAHAIQACQLEGLEHFDISANQISDVGVDSLASSFQKTSVPKLREILLGENDFGDSGVRAIADTISRGNLQLVEQIVLLPNGYIEDSSMLSLATSFGTGQAGHMRTLDFKVMPFGPNSTMKLAEAIEAGCLKSLERINLSATGEFVVSLTSSMCKGLLTNLEELEVWVTGNIDEGIVGLAQAMDSGNLKLLKRLKLSGSSLSIHGKSLVALAVASRNVPTLGMQNFHLPGIEWGHSGVSLGDRNTMWGDNDIIDLVQAKESGDLGLLEKLHVSGSTGITDNSLVSLAATLGKGPASIRELHLRGIVWGGDGFVKLVEAIESGNLIRLEKLDLFITTGITSESLECLAAALGNGKVCYLRELLLGGMGWTYDGLMELAKAVGSGNLKCLRKLDLSGSRGITGKILVHIMAALSSELVFNFQELLLSDVKLGDDGAVQLAKAIETGGLLGLKTLDISEARLCGEEALAMLVDAITGHLMQLRRLVLKNMGLGDEGVYNLAKAITRGKLPALESLDITSNPQVEERSTKALLMAMQGKRVPGELVESCERHQDTPQLSAPQLVDTRVSEPHCLGSKEEASEMTGLQVPSTPFVQEDLLCLESESSKDSGNSEDSRDSEESNYEDSKDYVSYQSKGNTMNSSVSHSPQQDTLNQIGQRADFIDHHCNDCDDNLCSMDAHREDKSQREVECEVDVAGKTSWLGTTEEEVGIRPDVQRLGFRSWDKEWEPGCTLVLADVTSSEEQLHFVFFHTKAMLRLFGCGLPYSKVTIILDKQLIWIQEMMEESWKTVWMSSNKGQWQPFLLEETRTGEEEDGKDSKPEMFHLDKSGALSQFGISVDGPHLQQFVKLSGSTASAPGESMWEPAWISWLRSVIHHAKACGTSTVPEQVSKRMEELSIRTPLGTAVSLKGKEVIVDGTGQEAMPRVQHEVDGSGGEPERKLVVIISFSRSDCPFFECSLDRELAKEITANTSTLPQRLSYLRPQLTVEFFRKQKEKSVTTTLEVNYQMRIQDGWPSGWFQNDLRFSFGSNDPEVVHKHTGIKGTKFIESDTTKQCGGFSVDQWGVGGEGSVQANLSFVTASGKGTGQKGSTSQTSWSDQDKYKQRKRVLESDEFFGVSDHSYDSTMERRALFWPVRDPSRYCYLQPECRFDQSGLRADVCIEALAEWDLYGTRTHQYKFEASKELNRCTKVEEEHSKMWFPRLYGESSRSSSTLQDQHEAKVTKETILQIFRKQLLLNHNFDDFFVRYEGTYKWNIIEESPVYEALHDERVMSAEKSPV